MLFEAAESAERHRWGLRREALLARRSQPAAEERVRALLQWSGSGSASRLMALAEVRRASFGRSWWPTLPSSGFSLQAVGHGLLVAGGLGESQAVELRPWWRCPSSPGWTW